MKKMTKRHKSDVTQTKIFYVNLFCNRPLASQYLMQPATKTDSYIVSFPKGLAPSMPYL